MKKLRASYTLLSLWSRGDYDGAVAFYNKLQTFSTPQMEEGIAFDNYVCDYVNKHNALPGEIGGDILASPKTQHKVVASFSEICDLVGVFDIITDTVLYEIKSGHSKDSAEYSNDFQVSLYLLLCELTHLPIEQAIIVHYNQYAKKHDRTVIWNTAGETERARNYLESLTPEIYTYFLEHNLLTDK